MCKSSMIGWFRSRYAQFGFILLAGLFLTACFPVRQVVIRAAPSRSHPADRMPGPGMMRHGPEHMPGPRMRAERFPTPALTPAPTATPGGVSRVSFRQDIQPIFDRTCVSCHGGQAGLYLTGYDQLMAGSAAGPVVLPGDPAASELLRRLTGVSEPRMPLGGQPLRATDIQLLEAWIAAGCPNN